MPHLYTIFPVLWKSDSAVLGFKSFVPQQKLCIYVYYFCLTPRLYQFGKRLRFSSIKHKKYKTTEVKTLACLHFSF